MWQKYKEKHPSLPKFKFKMQGGFDKDNFDIEYERNTIFANVSSKIGLNYAQAQLKIAFLSGHMGDFIGKNSPRYCLRPLWVQGNKVWTLGSSAMIALPDFMDHKALMDPEDNEGVHKFCRRVLELGYNSIILGSIDKKFPEQEDIKYVNVAPIFSVIKTYGIKVIIKPDIYHFSRSKAGDSSCCPLSKEYFESFSAFFSDLKSVIWGCDYILWKSRFVFESFYKDEEAENYSTYDLVLKELKMLESAVSGWIKPIYFLPFSGSEVANNQCRWFHRLLDEASGDTVVSFPVNQGSLWQLYRDTNPIWNTFRDNVDISSTMILPIANIGQVHQSEGLWPSLQLELIDRTFSAMRRHNFCGLVALTSSIPEEGSLLDCSLWITAQKMWRNFSAEALLDTWLRAHYGCSDSYHYSEVLKDIDNIVRSIYCYLYRLRHEALDNIDKNMLKTSIDKKLAILAHINKSLNCYDDIPSIFKEYFIYFSRDIKKILFYFSCAINIPANNILAGDDLKEGFWALLEGDSSGGRGNQGVKLLSSPFINQDDPVQNKIYQATKGI